MLHALLKQNRWSRQNVVALNLPPASSSAPSLTISTSAFLESSAESCGRKFLPSPLQDSSTRDNKSIPKERCETNFFRKKLENLEKGRKGFSFSRIIGYSLAGFKFPRKSSQSSVLYAWQPRPPELVALLFCVCITSLLFSCPQLICKLNPQTAG